MPDISTISTEELLRMQTAQRPALPIIEQQSTQPSFGIENIPTEQLLNRRANNQLQLIDQLRGSLPLSQQKLTGLPIQKEALIADPQKQKAFDALIQSGITKEQIQTVLDIQKRTDPGIIGQIKQNFGEDVGGLIGGIAGAKLALSLGQIPPFTALPEEFVTVPIFVPLQSTVPAEVSEPFTFTSN